MACLQFSWEGSDRISTASYTSCVSKLYVQSRAQASVNMMGRNRKILNSTFGLHKQVLAPAQTCTTHPFLRTHAYIPLTDTGKKKKSKHKYKKQKSLQWLVPISSKRKREIKPKPTKQTHIPKSKQQQNPAGSGVSAKYDKRKLEQGHKSPRFRNHTATAAGCWNSLGACSLQYGYTFI